MNILVIDDLPEFKAQITLEELKELGINLQEKYIVSVNSAIRYIFSNYSAIDLIILDLGLPIMDDSFEMNELNGLMVLSFLVRKKIYIPVVINSTTTIPNENEVLEDYTAKGLNVCHTKKLTADWLYSYIQTNCH